MRGPRRSTGEKTYPKGRTISDEQLATLRLTPHRFHADWNYTIHPVRRR
jgi:Rhodopirellula transposase DDE domain